MITLDEAEALNLAADGKQTLVVAGGADAKFSELCPRAVKDFEIDRAARAFVHASGGRCRVVAVAELIKLSKEKLDFAAIDSRVGHADREFIKARLRG